MKKKVIWVGIIVILIAGAVLGVTLIGKGKNGAVKYRKEAVGRGDIQALVVTSGTLNPIDLVDVGSQVSGKITALYADYNSMVKKGQLLAELELEPLQMKIQQNEANYKSRVAALEQSKVALASLKNKYDRAMNLFDKKLVSIEDKETAETSYLSAKADVTAAEANLAQAKISLDLSKVDLSHAVIQAPVDGIVITRKVSVGQTLQAGMTVPVLFQIATDLTKMKVECNVDEADIGRLKEGQKVQFTVEAFPTDSFNGAVLQVRFAATTVSNVVTYSVVVSVDNLEKKLRPGMTATVSIIASEAKNILRVANAALRFTPDLPQAEIERYVKEAGERMMAQRQQQSGQAGASGAPAAGDPAGGQRAPGQASPQMGARSGSGQRRQQISRVWLQDKDGKLWVVFVRGGITDNSYTEILRSDLKEGDEVIIGKGGTTTTTATASSRPGGPPGGMMFIGR
ncbi:MAG: efflux RND transporter periplasmic adaptor subunit [Candidatus Aminicenantales bacterium]|jgi:HlyD family secretion protein